MNWLESFKHKLGFHGKDVEWLDGRTWAAGWYQRTYHCPRCNVIFHEGNVRWDTRQSRMSLSQLRTERDAELNRVTAYIQSRTKEFNAFKKQQDKKDDLVFSSIAKLVWGTPRQDLTKNERKN